MCVRQEISTRMDDRDPADCESRYHYLRSLHGSILWTEEEECLLRSLLNKNPGEKPNWTLISAYLPRRTTSAIKTHWRALKRRDQGLPSTKSSAKTSESQNGKVVRKHLFSEDTRTFQNLQHLTTNNFGFDDFMDEVLHSSSAESTNTCIPDADPGIDLLGDPLEDSYDEGHSRKRFRSSLVGKETFNSGSNLHARDDIFFDASSSDSLTVLLPTALLSRDSTPTNSFSLQRSSSGTTAPIESLTSSKNTSESMLFAPQEFDNSVPPSEGLDKAESSGDEACCEISLDDYDVMSSFIDAFVSSEDLAHSTDDSATRDAPPSPKLANPAHNSANAVGKRINEFGHGSTMAGQHIPGPSVLVYVPCVYMHAPNQTMIYAANHHSMTGLRRPPPGFRFIQAPALLPATSSTVKIGNVVSSARLFDHSEKQEHNPRQTSMNQARPKKMIKSLRGATPNNNFNNRPAESKSNL